MKSICLTIVAAVFLVFSAQAGHARESIWSMDDPNPNSLCVIPVVIGTPSYAMILNQGDLAIDLKETDDALIYEGCTDFKVLSALNITLSCKVKSNGKVPGVYSCLIENEHVAPTGDIPVTRTVCVKLEMEKIPPMSVFAEDRQVATVILTVAPRS